MAVIGHTPFLNTCILKEKFYIFILISPKYAPFGPIDSKPALVQVIVFAPIPVE